MAERAQALRAEACRIPATVDMNPILIKPSSDSGAQVAVCGRVWGLVTARDSHQRRVEELFPVVLECYRRLAAVHDVVVIEGAASPAAINLKAHDIVNMRMAAAACFLVGDIDRGGPDLLTPGVAMIERRLRRPCLGVIPHLPAIGLDEEDSDALENRGTPATDPSNPDRPLRVGVIALPHMANFTDFDPSAAEPAVRDPMAVEGGRIATGLGLLPIVTKRQATNTTVNASASRSDLHLFDQAMGAIEARGYEIHMGETAYVGDARPFGQVRRAGARDVVDDGAADRDGCIMGTSLHGLFDADDFRYAFLRAARAVCGLAPPNKVAYVAAGRDARVNRLASHVARFLDVDALLAWIGLPDQRRSTAESRA